MRKKIKIPKKVIGYGYSGVWTSPTNTIGWNTSPFISGKGDRRYPSIVAVNESNKGKRFFLCKITVEPLTDKLGRPITKILK